MNEIVLSGNVKQVVVFSCAHGSRSWSDLGKISHSISTPTRHVDHKTAQVDEVVVLSLVKGLRGVRLKEVFHPDTVEAQAGRGEEK